MCCKIAVTILNELSRLYGIKTLSKLVLASPLHPLYGVQVTPI